ncbi:hypothetical protein CHINAEXTREME_11215 [Halobiforma lacisalsi AJ5]|uniref:DUF58 domain-containing protein n=1 Tax=Natronobacterium lacisalsi AJ5 TaxID=358396 RepID=A0A1P8LR96_NATLA|nr:DUF58 domain-containing protein [Halobiforma lacisalsi]APW98327.1 hypothetical protein CHINAEXTREME_11215 [Halobiforma lacisalsi AJ5]
MSVDRRTVGLVAGTVTLAAAVAVSAGLVSLDLSEALVVLVAVLAGAIGLRGLLRRRGVRSQFDTPDPERTAAVPVPGENLTDAVSSFRRLRGGHAPATRGRRLRAGLREATLAVLTRFDGESPESAEKRLEDGDWTDDPIAAGFLSDRLERPDRSLRSRVGHFLERGYETEFRRGVRHAVAAIDGVGYESGESNDDDDDGGGPSLPAYDYGRPAASEEQRRTTTDDVDGIEKGRRAPTEYWSGIGIVALLAVGVGAAVESPAVLIAGVAGVGYAGFARAFEPPELALSVERTVSDDEPEPGDEIEVAVEITNESGRFVPDLRFVDGVPPGLVVTEGTSRLGTALRPGESVSLEYTASVGRGSHEFDPALAIARDVSQSTEQEFRIESETTVVCEPEMRPLAAAVPLRATATAFAGRLTTTEGGAGTTFHSVREYRPNDPLSRIDWNRRAKTGELTTLEFHAERSARAVVLVDARKAAYLAPAPDATHAVDRSLAAAGRIGASLLEAGHSVGLAGLGPVGSDDDPLLGTDPCWLAPASGRHHELEFRELLASHPQFDAVAPERETPWLTQLRTLRRRLSAETQIVLLTPLCDAGSADIARRLEARGHPVTVVSSDPTVGAPAGQRLARVARRVRRFDLERAGVPVIDWPVDESIDDVFARRAGARTGTAVGGGLR